MHHLPKCVFDIHLLPLQVRRTKLGYFPDDHKPDMKSTHTHTHYCGPWYIQYRYQRRCTETRSKRNFSFLFLGVLGFLLFYGYHKCRKVVCNLLGIDYIQGSEFPSSEPEYISYCRDPNGLHNYNNSWTEKMLKLGWHTHSWNESHCQSKCTSLSHQNTTT